MRKFEDSLPLQLLKAREASMLFFRPLLNEYSLTEQQWRVLRALHEYKEMESKELATSCCLLSPSLTGILTRLQQQGYITRRKSTEDQRITLISLTSKANKLIQHLSPEIEARYKAFTNRLGEKKLEQLMDIIKELSKIEP
ncbi:MULTISPECIES: homoprotocatechuate degradation operon regulator HpaR [unclassified Neptuniibacter]|jgi:homoprotocatechuate degradation regulator HpaR|uniref:homoprotocatechuate degradation operon regulator HpaR n=1 Tax=unclassified Neptuniibacter TaxID=2630693 RepID=UPI0026E43067|nr:MULTISPECIES: homoprotocatechuate degradation operon regulator HpaR [unclassified Neptuniibacter]MDO6513687.1 homoprotocatechuate degradation operon regulator HpaR [Neptuniibacter sp. 2_MG-2023]MDO6593828.1 homoprotocatechuate degradation operon regulator HpaR [Neptuniibacter sp. 1_MG-2023]